MNIVCWIWFDVSQLWPDLKKTRLPHTQYQTYDFTRNGLLVQYTIIFHSTVCLAQKSWVWFLCTWQLISDPQVVLWRHWLVLVLLYWCSEFWVSHKGLANAQVGMLWAQGRSKLDLWLSIIFVLPILSPPSTPFITIHFPHKKTAWILGVWKLFTHKNIANE